MWAHPMHAAPHRRVTALYFVRRKHLWCITRVRQPHFCIHIYNDPLLPGETISSVRLVVGPLWARSWYYEEVTRGPDRKRQRTIPGTTTNIPDLLPFDSLQSAAVILGIIKNAPFLDFVKVVCLDFRVSHLDSDLDRAFWSLRYSRPMLIPLTNI